MRLWCSGNIGACQASVTGPNPVSRSYRHIQQPFSKMIEDPRVIGSSPILRPYVAVSSVGRAAYYIDVSSFGLVA